MVRIHPLVDFTFENPEDQSTFPITSGQPVDAPDWVQKDLVFNEFVKHEKIIIVKGKREKPGPKKGKK